MKLKFEQSIATVDKTYNVGETYDVKNDIQAKSFVATGIAKEVVTETPSKKVIEKVEEVEQPKRNKKQKVSDK